MGSRAEILNDGGYRSDGRRQYELRDFTIDLSSSKSDADGSATVSHGLTIVTASVFGPREAKMRSLTLHDRAVIHVELNIAPFSTNERRRRGRGDKRILELAAALKSTFEPVIHTHLHPRSQIDIYVQVLEQDGGLLQAAINATCLALIDAGIPMSDYVAAITCGVSATHPLLDLTSLEESDVPHLTLAIMPKTGKVTLVTMETRLHVDRFEELVRLALRASKVLHTEMRNTVLKSTNELVRSMGGSAASRRDAALGGREHDDMDES